jgi:hypothetical protein
LNSTSWASEGPGVDVRYRLVAPHLDDPGRLLGLCSQKDVLRPALEVATVWLGKGGNELRNGARIVGAARLGRMQRSTPTPRTFAKCDSEQADAD